MNLVITKKDFESAVPAAREPKGKIFEVMEDTIKAKAELIGCQILGEPGINTVENGTGNVAGRLRKNVIRLACISAFLEELRGLDLVLTSTGFGVVSTQDTAPASKQRVDTLEGELRRKERVIRAFLIQDLFLVPGWSDTYQRKENVETLFFFFPFLESYAAISRPKPEDWDKNVPAILAADYYLRKHIGDTYMDELLSQLTSNALTENNKPVAMICQRFIGAWIAQNRQLQEELYMILINKMETNLSLYPTYARSKAYQLNHLEPYQNHAEDSAFHFVG